MTSQNCKIKCCLKPFKGSNKFDFIMYLPLSVTPSQPSQEVDLRKETPATV